MQRDFIVVAGTFILTLGAVRKQPSSHTPTPTTQGEVQQATLQQSEDVLRLRLGDIKLKTVSYGEKFKIGNVWVSFHPTGHVLGSAQIRLEHGDDVWVVSGDYKRDYDPTCEGFEVVECNTFITEATFGLPVYAWRH